MTKHNKYSLKKDLTEKRPRITQKGIKKVVNKIKNKDKPSTPR